jgi:hypothetical protein
MLSDSREVWAVTAIQAIRLSQLNLAARPEAIPLGYVAEVKEPAFCRMVSISDAINKNGRAKVKVEWTLSGRRIDDETTEYTNHIHLGHGRIHCLHPGAWNHTRTGCSGPAGKVDCNEKPLYGHVRAQRLFSERTLSHVDHRLWHSAISDPTDGVASHRNM